MCSYTKTCLYFTYFCLSYTLNLLFEEENKENCIYVGVETRFLIFIRHLKSIIIRLLIFESYSYITIALYEKYNELRLNTSMLDQGIKRERERVEDDSSSLSDLLYNVPSYQSTFFLCRKQIDNPFHTLFFSSSESLCMTQHSLNF